jgi:hypothetical protein
MAQFRQEMARMLVFFQFDLDNVIDPIGEQED